MCSTSYPQARLGGDSAGVVCANRWLRFLNNLSWITPGYLLRPSLLPTAGMPVWNDIENASWIAPGQAGRAYRETYRLSTTPAAENLL